MKKQPAITSTHPGFLQVFYYGHLLQISIGFILDLVPIVKPSKSGLWPGLSSYNKWKVEDLPGLIYEHNHSINTDRIKVFSRVANIVLFFAFVLRPTVGQVVNFMYGVIVTTPKQQVISFSRKYTV